jgi:uncharacterized protein involved in type VI secretion and phage assembly
MNTDSDNPLFFGKFRGVVTNNQDPQSCGRIKARVPDMFGDDESGWAMPCAPFGGSKTGFFALPSVNAGVWIEFEGGDPDYPIWSGCWWGSPAEMPPVLLPAPGKKVVLQTEGGNQITFDDSPGSGGILLETSGGQKIKLTANGIEIDNGNGATIQLNGPAVNINRGALEVQ